MLFRSPPPVSSYLASTLENCLERKKENRLFKLLREEAIGNLDQSLPHLHEASDKDALRELMHPCLLNSLAVLTALSRYWPKQGSPSISRDSFVKLALCCYAQVSFGSERWSLDSKVVKRADPRELKELLLSDRDDIDNGLFAGLTLDEDYFLDFLTKDGTSLSWAAKKRLYSLLLKYPSPSLMPRALEDSLISSHNGARNYLLKNITDFARMAPLILDYERRDLIPPTLELLSHHNSQEIYDILMPRLERLLNDHPRALGKFFLDALPKEFGKALIELETKEGVSGLGEKSIERFIEFSTQVEEARERSFSSSTWSSNYHWS